MKRLIGILLFLVIVVAATFAGKYIILGKAQVISLKSDPISGVISSSFQSNAGNNYLPILGRDYMIKTTKYFDDGQWAIVSTQPLNGYSDPAIFILKEYSGIYRVVAGPSNDFLTSSVAAMPSDVVQYLKSQDLITSTIE